MADAVSTILYRRASIISLKGESFDLSENIVEFDYSKASDVVSDELLFLKLDK